VPHPRWGPVSTGSRLRVGVRAEIGQSLVGMATASAPLAGPGEPAVAPDRVAGAALPREEAHATY
jgi:hypothetical protein